MTGFVHHGRLTLGCADMEAMPLFAPIQPDGSRGGYEPAAARLVAEAMGLEVRWEPLVWADFYPALEAGRVDAVWCGQGITDARRQLADFSTPYAIFDESLVVRADNAAAAPADLAGQRIGAIVASTNMALAETFPGVVTVPFAGTADVLGDMIRALRDGSIDGFVDDDVVMVPLDAEPDLRLAFTVPTGNRWGVAVRRGDHALRGALDHALARVVETGALAQAWTREIPFLPFPLGR